MAQAVSVNLNGIPVNTKPMKRTILTMHAHIATIATIALIVPIAPILPIAMIAVLVMIALIGMNTTGGEIVNTTATGTANPIAANIDPMMTTDPTIAQA